MSSAAVSLGSVFSGTGEMSASFPTTIPTATIAWSARRCLRRHRCQRRIFTQSQPMGARRTRPAATDRPCKRRTAGRYSIPARPLFDVTLLGLGVDGHTASLLPGEPVLEERQRWVAAVSHGRPEARITMTYPAIDSSRRVAFLVTGRRKAPILREIRAGDRAAPASRVRPVGELIWFVDQAAASEERMPN